MTNFPTLNFSKKAVEVAGKALRGKIPWEDNQDEAIRIFRVAHGWRDSHAYPTHRLRLQLAGQIRRMKAEGISASRLKRMSSIRQKLRTTTIPLTKIQDLGGCRAILPSIADVRTLVDRCAALGHEQGKPDDYITQPKPDGYRSHHLKMRFTAIDEREAAYQGRRVEFQIRTRMQHSWATAVEAVGLFLNQDLKHGDGDQDWQRLFRLMSAEFALAEESPQDPELPDHSARVAEIKDLEKKLSGASLLENLRQAFAYTRDYRQSARSKYYLIKYDSQEGLVDVRGYDTPVNGTDSYDSAENSGSRYNAVLVEVDKIDNLEAAFPNYFGDVQLFKSSLAVITNGKTLKEFTLPPQPRVNVPKPVIFDPRWLRRRGRLA